MKSQARPREAQQGGHMRGALSELHNLQAETAGYLPPPPPPQHQQRLPPPPYDHPSLPLLTISGPPQPSQPTPAPGFFPLLRILPPGASEHEMQRTRIEETRQRLLQKFQQQVLQDKENMDQASLAQRLLHLEPQAEAQESARSEKSQASERLPSEREESKHEAAEPERAASAQSTASAALDASLTEGARAGSADVSINDGYALPRGIFESYLQLGEHLIGPESGQTSAAFQLKMAQAMQKQVEKRVRPKVDFSTMTHEQVDSAMGTDPAMEVVRTAEAATSITRDTGVDPIEEAVRDYNLRRHNNVIPPDIFMGLRFADQDGQAGVAASAPSDEPSKGRSYLNVVDIRASAVLRNISERTQAQDKQEEGTGSVDLDSALLASQRAALQMGGLEDSLREKLAPQTRSSEARGHDSLTVRMFDQLRAGREDRMSVAVMPRSSMSEPKTAMLRRLQDMSDQIRAIDDMSQNIEREFKSSHLLLNTIQDVNASIQRSRSPSPDRLRVSPPRHKELRYSLEESTQEFDEREEDEEVKLGKKDKSWLVDIE
ncbi:hypothetical protein PoB_004750600 [Plakobranchus ocellatus]|uniref:Uncharacterized protein n=1 Tax=Plakobranchus ocellatus TaxID=259542 RepID=A0AAV4BPR6_9GAST|nr:hypothetical protein PoB_004750600 [Plakobranchus ocellatus]